jgi:hypothetical protein
LESLGRVSFGKEERSTLRVKKPEKENIPLVEIKQKKEQAHFLDQRVRK